MFGFEFVNTAQEAWRFLVFPLAILAAWWTWKDAARMERRFPWAWAGLSLSLFPLGFVIYLLYRTFGVKRKI